ncbi:uncharacterized protein LOC115393351 [Salarias fasciatus]|uniref:Uncharacterized LOC115393351 n=1 Tax=Salarias fasciatus TaxID=181472 RepID=A0A672FV69_SALFA|nr:uncharacterized protein LOC115393351 [Salarias fasciatus]
MPSGQCPHRPEELLRRGAAEARSRVHAGSITLGVWSRSGSPGPRKQKHTGEWVTRAEMSVHSTSSPPTHINVTPWDASTAADINSTAANTSTPASSALEEIGANNIISRCNNVYSLIAAVGLLAGCFLLYSFIQTYRAHRRLAWLDCLLWVFCGVQLLLLLLSLHAVAHRPYYLRAGALGCAALSFAVNVASLCGLLVLVLMAYVLTLDPPSHALLRKPRVCAAGVVLTSVLISLLLAGLRGPSAGLEEIINCSVDPVQAGVSYAAAKLCTVFLVPYIFQLGLLVSGCVRQWRSNGRFLSGSEEGPMFLTVTAVMFLCLLFHSVVLVSAAQQGGGGEPSHGQRALLSVAESALFSGSAVSLVLVLLMHRPCRESLHGVLRQLRDCCRSPGRTQTHRNIIAPHIEITDTLQDIES